MLNLGIIQGSTMDAPILLTVTYANLGEVQNGTEFKPATVIEPPIKVCWPIPESTTGQELYTLSMIDPDSKPVQTNHWLVVNIPGNDLEKGHIVAPYSGPKPPEGTGLHRYILTVYKQKTRIPELPLADTAEARHTSTLKQFVEEYELGNPIAGNFLTAQPDEYSLNFWKTFKHK